MAPIPSPALSSSKHPLSYGRGRAAELTLADRPWLSLTIPVTLSVHHH